MHFWRRWTRTNHSLVIAFDKFPNWECLPLEQDIAEISRFYQFVTLSELSEAHSQKSAQGLASLIFLQARKGVAVRAIPILIQKKVPFSVMICPSYVGTNRLPFLEELDTYFAAYSDILNAQDIRSLKKQAWSDPDGAHEGWSTLKSRCGRLPVEHLNPLDLFMTWGALREFPGSLVDFGYHLNFSSRHTAQMKSEIDFIRRRIDRSVKLGYLPLCEEEDSVRLLPLGITTLIANLKGELTPNTPLTRVPLWKGAHEGRA